LAGSRSRFPKNIAWLFVIVCSSFINAQQNKEKPRVNPPCDGGLLNSKVTFEAKPIYSKEARLAKVEGIVIVRVRVDEEGRVYNAIVCAGNQLLRQSSIDAAYRTRLSPTLISGTSVKVAGILQYIFKLDKGRGRLYKPTRAQQLIQPKRK